MQIDTLKSTVAAAVDTLAETTLSPKFIPWEVEAAAKVMAADLAELGGNHQASVQELLHPAAYGSSSALGKPLYAKESNIGGINGDVLGDFIASQYGLRRLSPAAFGPRIQCRCRYSPNRMVLAAAGYDHDELVTLANNSFGGAGPGPASHVTACTYQGGEVRVETADDLTHFAVGFEGAGWKSPSLVPLCVLNAVMGGGSSFSAGGPGKGMYTRLYQNVLNRHHEVEACSVFNSFYNETGIFGVYGAAPANALGRLVSEVCDELNKMAEVPFLNTHAYSTHARILHTNTRTLHTHTPHTSIAPSPARC